MGSPNTESQMWFCFGFPSLGNHLGASRASLGLQTVDLCWLTRTGYFATLNSRRSVALFFRVAARAVVEVFSSVPVGEVVNRYGREGPNKAPPPLSLTTATLSFRELSERYNMFTVARALLLQLLSCAYVTRFPVSTYTPVAFIYIFYSSTFLDNRIRDGMLFIPGYHGNLPFL